MDATAALAALLHADGPDPAGPDLQLFGRFVGAWTLRWTGFPLGGPEGAAEGRVHATGDLAVSWVLGGRALQDVWAVPGPGRPGCGSAPRAFFGTTLRMSAADGRTWRSLWFDPVGLRVRLFTGTPRADGGVQLSSTDDVVWLRWTFDEVRGPVMRPEAFRWTGEQSGDRGVTWQVDDVMEAARRLE